MNANNYTMQKLQLNTHAHGYYFLQLITWYHPLQTELLTGQVPYDSLNAHSITFFFQIICSHSRGIQCIYCSLYVARPVSTFTLYHKVVYEFSKKIKKVRTYFECPYRFQDEDRMVLLGASLISKIQEYQNDQP